MHDNDNDGDKSISVKVISQKTHHSGNLDFCPFCSFVFFGLVSSEQWDLGFESMHSPWCL